ncbi:MAD2 mitotic arrest deficient-like 1 [Aphanomyces cochlioides]|nr:MAD2 mitotic arrest deficient-like 1 [Aphanomyces cochlioides]
MYWINLQVLICNDLVFIHVSQGWLVEGQVQKLVVVVANATTEEILERWVFDVFAEPPSAHGVRESTKPVKEIMSEIQAIMRQITASVSFLPLLNDPCTFDLLVYTDKDVLVPQTWEESDPRFVNNSVQVRLRSFSTKVHKVDAMVAYKDPDTTL